MDTLGQEPSIPLDPTGMLKLNSKVGAQLESPVLLTVTLASGFPPTVVVTFPTARDILGQEPSIPLDPTGMLKLNSKVGAQPESPVLLTVTLASGLPPTVVVTFPTAMDTLGQEPSIPAGMLKLNSTTGLQAVPPMLTVTAAALDAFNVTTLPTAMVISGHGPGSPSVPISGTNISMSGQSYIGGGASGRVQLDMKLKSATCSVAGISHLLLANMSAI